MASVNDFLASARQNLLDLSNRNRLLNCRLDSDHVTRIFDELPDQVYRMLVNDKKSMKFLPIPESKQNGQQLNFDLSETELEQPQEDEESNGLAKRHTDSYLQTKLTSARLQTRLLRMSIEAQTAIEEQGINILYLAMGFLKWYDADSSTIPRYAPLILIPAKLDRRSATSKFQVSWSEEDIETNESLLVKLQKEFGIILPRLSDDAESITPSSYFSKMQKAVGKSKWEVANEMLLGFFAFGKLRMWKDLDPEVWNPDKGPANSDIINSILFSKQLKEPSPYSDDEFIDHNANVGDLLLVKDADSSQILSILDVLNGRSAVIQGPPGTGKSQTITNIIANVVASGKTVLFVAEKMAALEVVKRWLDQVGLGDACLELHSFKARKTQVVDSIRKTIESGRPVKPDHKSESNELRVLRDRLNEFAFGMNTPIVEGGVSPYQAIGIIVRHSHITLPLDNVPLTDAANWNKAQLGKNRELIALVAKHLSIVGNPSIHPWRGVMAPALLPSDRLKVAELTIQLLRYFNQLIDTFEAIRGLLHINVQYTLANHQPVVSLCNLLVERPECDLSGVSNHIWLKNFDEIFNLLNDGGRFAALHSRLLEQVTENALCQDYVQTRNVFIEKGELVTRFLSSDYWKARKHYIKSCRKGRQPKNLKDTISLLNDLCEYREIKNSITQRDNIGSSAFGLQWKGTMSNWGVLLKVAVWVPQVIHLIKTNAVLINCEGISREDIEQQRDRVKELGQKIREVLDEWDTLLKYDYIEAFEQTHDSIPLTTWIDRLNNANSRVEAVYEWIEYRKNRDICKESKMSQLVDLFDKGKIQSNRLVAQYEYSSANEILKAALINRSILAQFNGETHEHIIKHFQSIDKKLIQTTRQYLACKLWDRLPQPTIGNSDDSPMNYLMNTLRRRRGIPPIRKLMERVGCIVTQIKPCFMMSPMSIAQFLPPNTVEFDVLVIDEASQMKPEDALGALARCKQCVIVGDSKQLPPTQFFERLGETEGNEEDIGDVESILEAAAHPIGGMRGGRMLRWHYRSKHESLIAFSNKEFYESKLNVFPSPINACNELGLVSHFIEKGVYSRSGSRKNLIEAESVANFVISHAKNCGELSLGVVALSKQQQEAIMDKLEELRRENQETEWFFDSSRLEPFFVKNLENVQGDERDVIFISIGYGKDPQGYFYMNFGPINNKNGWRRLNVLITRARLRCEVFHSIRPDNIRVTDLSNAERDSLKGRVALRNYLEYVQTGQLEQPSLHGEDFDSLFEESVAEALRQNGIQVVPQVGVAKFRIDLGVIDPNSPGRYLLGIECDGATYHRARSARDRDRLRQEVLENLGWKIHRIWSLDWLKDRDKEIRRLLLAIEETKSNTTHNGYANGKSNPKNPTVIKRTNSTKEAKHPHELVSKPYAKYKGARLLSGHPNDMGVNKLAELVVEIVRVESPIQIDELNKRVAEMFGLKRVGNRIQSAVLLARQHAEKLGEIKRKGKFLWDIMPGMISVRNRSNIDMDIERIAPEEIHAAAEGVNKIAHGLTEDALFIEIARCLGYHHGSTNIDRYIKSALKIRKMS